MKRFYYLLTALVLSGIIIAQDSPQKAPINPEFQNYISNKSNGYNLPVSDEGFVLGLTPQPINYDFSAFTTTDKSQKSLPSSYDLRIEDGGAYLSSVKNQGSEGACWAFATYAAIESYWMKIGLPEYNLSEQNLATCHGFDWSPSDGGNVQLSTAYLSRYSGPILEDDDPYTLPSNPNCVTGLTPTAYVAQARYLPALGETEFDPDIIKQAVIDYGVLYTSMHYANNYMSASNYTFYYNGSDPVNHGVAIVGWDDNKIVTGGTAATPSNPGAWIIKNSWGPGWGESGYFYISYEDTKNLSSVAYFPSYIEHNTNSHLYYYDEFGAITGIGWGDHYGLVKYTATENQELKKIGTYVLAANTTVSISVYSDFNGSSLLSGNLIGSISAQTCDLPGYYTFEFDTPINLSENDDFYIRVRYNSSYTWPIPLEMEYAGYASDVVIESGVGWISPNGTTTWDAVGNDITGYEYDICIKAYATKAATEEPIADFSANTQIVVVGNSVNFFDNSSGIPETYEWTFEGGTPDVSNAVNPVIQYNSVGSYDVTLRVENSFGFDIITKENYITVVSAPIDCEFIDDNLQDDDNITFYLAPNGYLTGPNDYGFTGIAEYYNSHINTNLTGARIGIGRAEGMSANPIITMKVWDVNSGLPNNVLYSEDFLIDDFSPGYYNDIVFNESVIVPEEFFIGYEIYDNTPRDTFAIYQVVDRGDASPYPSTAYFEYNGSWYNADDLFTDGFNTSFIIYPEICPMPPIADFTADITSGCESLIVQFTDLSSSNTDSWEWDFGDGNNSIEQNPEHEYENPGTYTVSLTVTNAIGADTHTMIDYIVVGTIPETVTVSGGTTQCGGEVTLTASGGIGGTIYWQGTTSDGEDTSTPTATYDVSTSGTYYFRAQSAEGCWGSQGSAVVTINPIPDAVIVTGGGTICGESAILEATGGNGGNIYWQATTSNGENTSSPSVSETVTSSGTYYFRARSAEGCWGEQGSAVVTLNPIPEAVGVSGGTTQCGGEVTLTASGGAGGTIYWQGTTSNGENTSTPASTYDVSASGTYYFRARSAEGCWGPQGSAVVTINPIPDAVIVTGGGTVCGESVLLEATGGNGGTIYWQATTSNGENTSNPSVSETVTSSGTYYFRARSAEGCWGDEGSAVVTLNSIPDPVTVSGGTTQCGGDVSLTASGGDGGSIYWQGTTADGEDTSTPTATYDVSASGTYYFRARSAEGCWGDQGSAIVTINPIPDAVIVYGGGEVCGTSAILEAFGGTGGTIYWQGTTFDGEDTSNPSVSETVTSSGTYYFRAQTAEGCWGEQGSAEVTLSPEVTASFSSTNETEPDANDGSVTVTVLTGTPDYTYEWAEPFEGIDQNELTGLSGGTYCLTISDANGCTWEGCETIFTEGVDPIAVFSVDFTEGCDELTVQFTCESEHTPTTWLWDFGDGNQSISQNPLYTYTSPGAYTVSLTVTNISGSDEMIKEDYIKIGETPEFTVNTVSASGPDTPDGAAWVEITAGIPPYEIHWSTTESGTHIENLLPDNYTVEVFDSFGCPSNQDFEIDWSVYLNSIFNDLHIYPNPVKDILSVKHTGGDVIVIRITDITGKTLAITSTNETVTQINLIGIASGLYFVDISKGTSRHIERIIIE